MKQNLSDRHIAEATTIAEDLARAARPPFSLDRMHRTGGRRRSALPPAVREAELRAAARATATGILERRGSSATGLSEEAAAAAFARIGPNVPSGEVRKPVIVEFATAFANPFILILAFLVAVMTLTDIVWADPDEGPDPTGVITISLMIVVSAVLRFVQEHRTGRTLDALRLMVRSTSVVTRSRGGRAADLVVPVVEIVPSDLVQLAAGDVIPADVRFVRATNLSVNQSMLTGESGPVGKRAGVVVLGDSDSVLDAENLGFMGTSVASGSAAAVVIATGDDSTFGSLCSSVAGKRPPTSFDRGIRGVSFLLIRFMLVMVPVVFVLNGITSGWTSAFLFAVTTAVGLTPEMLPLVVTANLAKGARFMARRRVIVKRLNSIQDLGAMDVLCTDKTGTITDDRIVLERHLDVDGRDDAGTLELGAIVAHFQTGFRNPLDEALLAATDDGLRAMIDARYVREGEIPFDFERRRMSVVVADGPARTLITKGAVEEVLDVCVAERRGGTVAPFTAERRIAIDDLVAAQNADGLRVLAVATRSSAPSEEGVGGSSPREPRTSDETEMVLIGFLGFLDAPKETACAAIAAIQARGTAVKIITGDSDLVAATICRRVGLDVGDVVLGAQIDDEDDETLVELAERTTLFAKTNPAQKARIVSALRRGGHVVGFLGDGANDAAALRSADVGISVDTAVDIAKESADIILLDKDLTILEHGMVEGRRTFANTMKYIRMTASSNFGNVFSVLVASAVLPFIPMVPIVVLIQNLVYDLSMLTLPWDDVDEEYLRKPRTWESSSLAPFMFRIGPLSSIFDITTFALMWFVFGASTPEQAALFQSGWFVESLLSQTLIVHMIRTRRIPFVQSRASLPVLLATGAVCVFGVVLPFLPWGGELGLVPLPIEYFPWLVATLVAYCALVQWAKARFVRRFGSWV